MSREKILVAVKNDKIVLRNPINKQRITTKGTLVVKDAFWMRRLKAGDCILVDVKTDKKNITTKEKGQK